MARLNERFFKTSLYAAASVGALWMGMTQVVMAQDTVAQDQADADQGTEIVVTAQRRSERSVDVPISVTSVSGERLESAGIGSVVSIAQTAPGMRFDYSGPYVQPTIRGVGSALAGPGLNSNVAVYVDGYYVPNALGNDFQLLSVSGVDVLKGPQGTLFGRNATGGAVLVTTRDPSFDPTLQSRLSYSRFKHVNYNIYAATGLTDTLAADVAAYVDFGDGFIRNVNTGRKDGKFDKWSVRTKLMFQPNDDTKLTLTYSHSDIQDPSASATSSYAGLTSATGIVPGTVVATRRGEVSNGGRTDALTKSDTVSFTGKFDLGAVALTSYTQYRNERTRLFADYDGTAVQVFTPFWQVKDRTITQELNLTSTGKGPLTWVLGAYYYNNKNSYPFFKIDLPPVLNAFDSKVRNESFAAFADVTYEVVPSLFVTGGMRYSIDKIDASYNNYTAVAPALAADRNNVKFKKLTPRVNVRYQLDRNTNVYASFNQGYKAGFLQVSSFDVRTPVNPEKIDAYEVGFKTARGPIRFDIAGFYYNYRDLQVASYQGVTATYANAARSRIYGVDGQLTYTVMDGLELSAAGAYTHANYRSFAGAQFYQQVSPSPLFSTTPFNASGFQMPRAPRFTGNLGVNYKTPVGEGSIELNGNLYLTSKFYFDSPHQFVQKGYELLNLRATYNLPGEHVAISVFGTNVTDSKYLNQVLPGTYAIQQTYGEPASYGVSLGLKF